MDVLSPNDILQIATLARLELTKEEQSRYAKELTVVFGYMNVLDEVDIDDVPETSQVTGLEDVFREDKAVPCGEETKKKLLAAFPDRVGNLLKVPAVFE